MVQTAQLEVVDACELQRQVPAVPASIFHRCSSGVVVDVQLMLGTSGMSLRLVHRQDIQGLKRWFQAGAFCGIFLTQSGWT